MKRSDVIDNKNIQGGDVIVGLASSGQATYEKEYNGGMGSNGLTSARHDVFSKYLAQKYPESYDAAVPEELVYSGGLKLTDKIEELGIDAGKMVLSPTRTYAPVIKVLLDKLRSQIHGMVHCSGGPDKSYALRREQACNQGQSLPYPTVIPHDSGAERYGLERDVQGIQYGTPDGDLHRSRACGRSNQHLKKLWY